MNIRLHLLPVIRPLLPLLLFPCIASGQIFTIQEDFFQSNAFSESSTNVEIIDLNQDDFSDVILVNETGSNAVLWNNSQGSFTKESITELPVSIEPGKAIACADFDLDHDIDIIVLNDTEMEHDYYFNDGSGNFIASELYTGQPGATSVKAADINADGAPDLLIGRNGQNLLFINRGNGTFRDETHDRLPLLEDQTNDLVFFDFDGDGDLDILTADQHRNRLLVNNGEGVFSDQTINRLPLISSINTQTVCIGDVDGDGDPDIFLSVASFNPSESAQNRLLVNMDGAYFFEVTATQLPKENQQTADAVFADIDGDHDLDLLTANSGSEPIAIYENNGRGLFTNASFFFLGEQSFLDACKILSEDFNKDGFPDIYLCVKGQKDLLLLYNPEGKESTTTGTSEALSLARQMRLFPNPVGESFTLDIPVQKEMDYHFSLTDLVGQSITTLTPQHYETTFLFDLSTIKPSLAKGLYLLQIQSSQQLYAKKLWIK